MYATKPIAAGEFIVQELPIVIGRCCVDRCPGCPGPTGNWRDPASRAGGHAVGCYWAKAEQQPQLARARRCHRELSTDLEKTVPADRENHIRVCCLLAICIQAAVDAPIRSWLLTELRPSFTNPDPNSPIVANTLAFARKFANVIPAPASSNCVCGPTTVSDAAWVHELYTLLLHVQETTPPPPCSAQINQF